jgi:hypothetical protein
VCAAVDRLDAGDGAPACGRSFVESFVEIWTQSRKFEATEAMKRTSKGPTSFSARGIPRGKRVPLSPFLRKTRRKQIVSGRYERAAIGKGLAMPEFRFRRVGNSFECVQFAKKN